MTLSLRTRVLLGAILWTAGLVLLSFVVIAHVFKHFPDLPVLGKSGSIHYIWGTHALFIVVTSVIAMVGGALQVRWGLAGIARLRTRLGAVHRGQEARVGGTYVSEVQPLVDDLNALLDQREEAVRRAVAKAGDLAHGLKTPLALLAREAERATAAGQVDIAAAVNEQVERMRRQIDYHLAHARAAASGTAGARALVLDSAEGLVRTMRRLHADRELTIDVQSSDTHVTRVQREDLDEMLGNLLDNACKWARSRIVLASTVVERTVMLTVDDDGPGLAAEMRERVLQRGVRADEKARGSGLGLAIVRDLSELYSGSVALSDSPLGGLRVTLSLPRADGSA
jgi:signal transduction histidine kinase